MTPKQARARIEGAFKAEWSGAPIDYNNDMQAVPAAPFVRLTVRHGSTSHASSMSGEDIRYERFGVVFVQVFTQLGVGPATADDLARKAADILEGRVFGLASGDPLYLGAATQNDIGNNDAGHWQVNVSIPFAYAEYRTKRYA